MKTVAERHTIRTCIGCRRKAEPSVLCRVARRPDGSFGVGPGEPGRGAWLCAGSPACFDAAVQRRALSRALRCEVGTADRAELREKLFHEGMQASSGRVGQ